jgi:hypothetical protein
MQRLGLSGVIAVIITVGLITVKPGYAHQEGEPGCTLATLHGLYVFDASGFINLGAGWLPKAVVEFLEINGDGSLSSIATANIAGNLPFGHDVQGTGSYTVNPDCTGTLTFSPHLHFDIFVAPSGGQFHMIQTDPSNVLAGVSRRLSARGPSFGARVKVSREPPSPRFESEQV